MRKLEYLLKAILMCCFLIYASIQDSIFLLKITDSLFGASMDKQFAPNGNRYQYVIAGGSNALVGISAEDISTQTGLSTYNFAISACEGEKVLNYANWLRETQSSTKTIIYSSMNIWYLVKASPCASTQQRISLQSFMTPRIETPLARAISLAAKDFSLNVNQFGDLTVLACDDFIPPFEREFVDTGKIDQTRIKHFIESVNATKRALNASEILVRIPPIYITPQSTQEFEHYIIHISQTLKNHGITLIGAEQALTSDSAQMCFGANHPTPKARKEYTDALVQELKNHQAFVSK